MGSWRFDGYVNFADGKKDYYKASMDLLKAEVRHELFSRDRQITTKIHDAPPAVYSKDSNVRNSVITSGSVIEGTCQLCNASVHVNKDYDSAKRSWDTVEVVLDEVKEAKELGVEVGDIVCFDPRTRRTASGYLKSRFLDDKLSVGILMGFAKYLSDNHITLKRRTYIHVTVYEEVGHGGSASVPAGLTEAISVDMGCVGDGLNCTERQVSICAKDSGGPYSYEVVGKLIDAAKKTGADYAVDVYPYYGSDVESTLRAGFDIRHGLIGPGVYASHGYERSHIDGVMNTLKVLCGYLDA
jgi:putative aminopeptidase FrvX